MKLNFIILFMTTLLATQAKAQSNASSILDNALTQAKAENKNVFVKYSASWCGWCKKMDKQMKSENCKPLFDTNYIIVTLMVNESKDNKHLETPGAIDYLKKHEGEKSGIPFWVILNSDGSVIENSYNNKGENLGCPATKEEVSVFINKLKNTSNLTDKNLNIISEVFLSKL